MASEIDEEPAAKKKQVTHEDEEEKEEKLDIPTDETGIETTEGDETEYEGDKKEDESEQALEELPDSTKKKYKPRKSIKSAGSRKSKVSSTFSDEEDVEVEDEFSEEGEEEEIEEEEEPEHYDAEEFLSGPTICEGGTLPLDILEFFHSFGYNCRKKFNLEVLDENTVVFASGNFLHFFNLETKDIWFRRSALGQGIGHIKRNPNKEYSHFAVAECGRRPIIILYNWPEMTILCILRGGAKKLYSNMDYSPDGELLVSQSGEPDYLITVWNWKEHKILLRNKSYVNDVYSVKFSPYIPGEITTCGVGHIKFWKMARTFTGLKLQGELGRFGKTEYSDILGVLPMPDEKVVSGCDWGNILIWDGGLITLEVLRTLRKNCHEAPIVQIFYEDEELWTVSLDGHVRIWWYEKIDRADPPDDDRVILLDPSYDFYTPGMSLYQVTRRREEESMFIAQDGNGGIWQIDLNTVTEPEPSMQLYKCHAGKVVDIATYCNGRYLASLGRDGRLYIYNYLMKKLVFGYEFPAKGSQMIWPEAELLPTGDVILAGFCDGQVRVCVLNLKNEENISLTITQVIKPHNKPLTAIEINSRASIVITGAEDSTIFVFAVNSLQNMDEFLIPIGFIPAPDSVTCLTWYPKTDHTILVGCLHGQMMEVEVPKTPQTYTGVSYLLKVQPKYQNFMSYKSQIRRNIYLKKVAKRKAKKVEVKRIEMERIMKENPALEIDEEVFLADSESEEELEPLYIPEVRNRILWMRYTPDQTIWVSMAGEQQKYLILAMQDGSLRVNRINRKDFRDLKDYWSYTLHDNQYGFVSKLCFSHDQKFLFSCGEDGNVFAMVFHHETYVPPLVIRPMIRISPLVSVEDVDPYTKLSLEETKIKAEEDRIMKAANAHKANVRDILKGLKERYQKLLSRNNKLLPSQIIPRQELELDDRVLQYINNDFQSKLDLVKRKLAYDLEKSEVQMKKLLKYFTDPCDMHPVQISGINDPSLYLLTVRQRIMSPMFPTVLKICEEKIEEEKRKGRCVGLGESKVLDGDEKKSESLPKHWNEDQNNYSIRYVYQGKLYILKATNLDDALMVNLIRVDERTVSFLQLNKRDVATRSGSLDSMIPKHKDMVGQIKTQLIDKVIVSTKSKETGVQTECQSNRDRSARLITSQDNRLLSNPERQEFPYRAPMYGQDDLHPLGIGPIPRLPNLGGVGGGGMLFQPPGPSFGGGLGGRIPGGMGLPPGAVPPGARFDPFRPPDVDRFPPRRPNRPDPDEFPPPGYDDMFM
ncbi:unnamed protein product [Diabrotica balteata]|uniref:Uncharacterized protein n=1 Tax=Diabrotica balteata TaxID=107213 RepID=A0A9N9TER0_DIABA|nr:unnamed protein product [Diabrotica balteata]